MGGDGRREMEQYKFQKLQVYQLALAYVDSVYAVSGLLPKSPRPGDTLPEFQVSQPTGFCHPSMLRGSGKAAR